ncbi:MAG TPA: MBL fold metallo-hydrolase [Bacteroidales bacterium]|jgi:glyoxylase-like metal-dependent hydrolase (beta-lactamase superfamily II)|nr:MBL fold metallo-hydrolase [Bacteroidales bacterium]HNR42078.1 MBL fold metallo-hydrolase [Bacteroidales bacterium]HPM18737.1 MBL fold metallo-hydrolase [Bacteroidales bacterium]HQG77087.1 MBL fold metallo-hydrolase [Bacteroidales bacterium]
MKLNLFNITNFKVDGGAMFGVIPRVLWSRVCVPDENNFIVLALRSIVAETDGHVILVDTGWGDKQDAKFFRHLNLSGGEGLIEGLRRLGYSGNDITDVVFTHLHADHCGGATRLSNDGRTTKMVFPNAALHVSRVQWEWAVKNNPREEDSFLEENILPLMHGGRLNLIDEDCELFRGFSVRICYGHTPGLMYAMIDYNGKTIVFAGDLIPTAAHVPLLWNMSYDIETLRTIEEKNRLLNEALDKNHIIVFQHDELTECCTLEMTPKGIRPGRKFSFSEILRK